ncbi:MAG TPA: M23 family metallopeptidase [Puia sp.]|nr:M23 family metallopeptidase [Puia sp.]
MEQFNKYLAILVWSTLFWTSSPAMGQVDSNRAFLKSKGHWKVPISAYNKVLTDNQTKYCVGCTRIPGISFFGDSALPVLAVFDGKVISVLMIADMYGLVIRFGDYSIIYTGLSELRCQKGDKISAGQIIADLNDQSGARNNEMDVMLADKKGRFFDPEKWFDWEKREPKR